MAKFLKIQDWTVNFLEIYKIEGNKLILESGRELILNEKEKALLDKASDYLGLPNLSFD